MTDFRRGGNRRSDRVLDEGFVADLASLPMEDLRGRRAQTEQAEADLSYLRRLLQGRIDIVQAEVARRVRGDGESVLDQLTEVLAHDAPTTPYGLGRHTTVQPTAVGERRRRVELMAADVELSDLGSKSDEDLQEALDTFTAAERDVSAERHQVQRVMDLFGAEVARRYRDGEASVDSLLTEEQG